MFTGVPLILIGAVEPGPALAGFSHPAVISMAALFVVAAGMRDTVATQAAAPTQLGRPESVVTAQFRLIAPVARLFAFIKNTPVVAMCVPLVRSWTQRNRASSSKLLMPLRYASILGGKLTPVGSASNVTVTALYVESLRAEGLRALISGLRFWGSAFGGLPAVSIGIPYRSFDFPKGGAPPTLIPAVLCALICPLAVPFRPGP